MSVDLDEEEVFEDIRDRADKPMRRLFREYGRENAFQFTVGFVSSVGARILDLLPPLLLAVAIDSIFGDQEFRLRYVPRAWLPETQAAQLWFTVGIIGAAFMLGAILHWTRNWGWNSFAQNIQHDVRTDTYDKMQRLNMDFFADKQTGELMSILSNDVNRLERFLNDGMNSFFRLSIMVIGIAVILLSMNWHLALVALVPVPIIAFFTKKFIDIIQPKYADVRSSVGQLNSRLENNLGGIQVIKTANTESFESDRVEDVSGDYFDANWDAIDTRIKFFPGLRLISGFGFALTFVVGGFWVLGEPLGPLSGSLQAGEFVAFILYTQRFIWPMAQFGQIINMYQRAHASSERIFGLMDTPSRIQEDPDADDLVVTAGDIEFDDVSFGYDVNEAHSASETSSGENDDSRDYIVEDITFDVDGGETIALVGPTGAGKSTVMKLLLRMYDVDDGSIRIDGTDLRDVTIPSLRQQMGYVSQETFLFYGTVQENIEYGTFGADQEAVVEAAKMAEAHQFIQNLPDGYETKVGERGVKLSGGQRQRIALARAILKDPEILVLDEATSDVDTETEMLIQRSLDKLTADRTTFAIAHRLSTIKDADRIIVLEDGRIVERGDHESLLAEDGLYAKLWAVQAGEIDELPQEFIERAARRRSQVDAETEPEAIDD